MSTVKTNNLQIGQSVTATNNFTWYQPATPDGTVRLGVGNAGATSSDILIANSSGNLGLGVTPSGWASGIKAFQVGANSYGSAVDLNNGVTAWGSNYYNDGGNKFANASSRWALQYLQDSTSGNHSWRVSGAAGTAGNAISFTQAMTLDASGNLGIGVTSPGAKLDVKSQINVTNSSSSSMLGLYGTAFGYSSTYKILQIGASSGNYSVSIGYDPSINFSGVFSGDGSEIIVRNGASFITPNSGNTSFYINTLKLLDGNVLVGYGSSNGAYKLQVNSQIFATSSTIATSDRNYKTDVVPLSGSLSLVNKLNPVHFKWKPHPIHDFNTEIPTLGFLAQEVQEALAGEPFVDSLIKESECELPDGTKEKFLGIAEGNMIAILTAAIQELTAELNELKQKVNA